MLSGSTLRLTTPWTACDLGGGLSLSVVLKLFGVLFMTRVHVQRLEVSSGVTVSLGPEPLLLCILPYFLVTWASIFGLLIRKLGL